SRIVDGFAKKMADQFFTAFQDAVGAPEEGEEDSAEDAPKKGWFRRLRS
ncbi:MAG: carbon monoxide dehydrogenase, partial [Planktotalea sp.]|nr:carbon monoxide dehydrogenase [Planktotalea sp.]